MKSHDFYEEPYYAEPFFITPKNLSEACIIASGHNASYWIEQFTIQQLSPELRGTSKTLQQIADEYHFSSANYFSRYISKHIGMSPTKYREEHKH